MKFTLSWLEDHLITRCNLDEIMALMLKAGLEVEEVIDPAARLAGFTVAKVTKAVPHPDADRLRVCTVDTVDGEKQIVCGAPNARAGMSAIYAPLGAYIPGADFTLDKKPRKIRGVESSGMLCSAKELEAGDDHDGIIDLTEFHEVGTPAAEALGNLDPVIDFEVTPNRPDWLGVVGIARDLAAAGAGRFHPREIKPLHGHGKCPVKITIKADEACPIFGGVLIRDVKNGASPDWMQDRLRAVGITPKSMLVDVTNYISLDRARPLHAYDADKLDGTIVARLGKKGETLEALDGKTYDIAPDMCVIADDSGVIGLGGVMGGTSTAVSDETRNVFIECAWFDPMRTARTGRTTSIVSDARYRFERGVDPLSIEDGLAQAVQLIVKYCGGEATEPVTVGMPPAPQEKVTFKPEDVERLTGLKVKIPAMKKTLKDLGFDVEDAGEAWYLRPPRWRFDVEGSADLVEEIARLEGYDKLPMASLPPLKGGQKSVVTPIQIRVRNARRVLASRGFLEAVTWSFMPKSEAKLFGGGDDALTIANPVASELNQMRPSILANLAKAAQKGVDHGEREMRLFEAGPVYRGDGPKDQRTMVTAIVRPAASRHWQDGHGAYDVYSAKADLYAVLNALGQAPTRFQIGEPKLAHFHPGQSASVRLGPKLTVAHFGALHPRVLKALDVDGSVFGFELGLNALPQMKIRPTKTKSVLEKAGLTPIHRDFAFVVEEDLQVAELVKAARASDKNLISNVQVFDVYQGQGVADGKKSVAIEVTIQPGGEALKDADIEAISAKIVASVAKATGGELRG